MIILQHPFPRKSSNTPPHLFKYFIPQSKRHQTITLNSDRQIQQKIEKGALTPA